MDRKSGRRCGENAASDKGKIVSKETASEQAASFNDTMKQMGKGVQEGAIRLAPITDKELTAALAAARKAQKCRNR